MKQLPNLFTLLNLFFGCIALICILQNGISIVYTGDGIQYVDIPEKIWLAPLFIGLAAVADFIDGLVARLLKVSSPLGRELDSLADLVSFGVAPGMIIYQFLRMSFMRQPDGADISLVWLFPAMILPCAAAVRLARFNLDVSQSHSFKGVPVPAIGLLIASFPLIYWTKNSNPVISILLNKWFLYGLVLVLSYAMVRRFPVMAMKFNKASAGQQLPRIILLLISLISLFFLQWLAVPVIFLFYIVLSLIFKNRIV
ncbi:MAG: CDP-alcohol phosphatidyltransferase family protein [Bacteroidota bacterium]|nr:CDP-alcohol phosphatidyltransferase family protein [Bacteroidota bacterium]MDP4211473.1 CDP-alcohol phosphatidyltransferase family protein [Bacteroidota bacterium]